MVILRSQNKITDFLMILAWSSPFNLLRHVEITLLLFCGLNKKVWNSYLTQWIWCGLNTKIFLQPAVFPVGYIRFK